MTCPECGCPPDVRGIAKNGQTCAEEWHEDPQPVATAPEPEAEPAEDEGGED